MLEYVCSATYELYRGSSTARAMADVMKVEDQESVSATTQEPELSFFMENGIGFSKSECEVVMTLSQVKHLASVLNAWVEKNETPKVATPPFGGTL